MKNKPTTMPSTAAVTVALCGNPNSGKTTLFNALTGSNQKVGNWPGVTVERKLGVCAAHPTVAIVDTPGIYSLSPFAEDERIAHEYLTTGNPSLILNVVDSTNLQRNLFLTTQLITLGIPVIVALNMSDEAEKTGLHIDADMLARRFGCKFFKISAAKNVGVEQLAEYCATQRPALPTGKFSQDAQQRYAEICEILKKAQQNSHLQEKRPTVTEKIDKIVLNRWLAFPIFAAVVALVFYLSVGGLGGWLTGLINDKFTPYLQNAVAKLFADGKLDWLRGLLTDGVIGGVMSVVGFVPQVTLLFGFIAILESSGYMSRIAFITDRLLHKIGLGGRSFVSMILGCGCSVPAIMACRTIKNVKERNTTVTLTPFMPCSAKLALISFFTTYILNGNWLFAVSFYFLSILAVVLCGLVIKVFRKQDAAGDTFIMELPTYRMPTAKSVLKQMWERGKAFLVKAGTIILGASVVLWLLTNFNWKFAKVDVAESMLASVGKVLAPIFYPLGWNDGGAGWQFTISAFTGIVAKETVVSTLQILLPQGVENAISPLGAYSFVAYNLLTVPCIAAVSASFAEQGTKAGLKSIAIQVSTAYVVSLAIYQLGTIAHMHKSAFAAIVCCTVAVCALIWAFRRLFVKKRVFGCVGCPDADKCQKRR